MSEYIEREAAQGLLRKRSEELLQAGNPIPGGAVSGASLLLSLIPAADVAPVVHGEWKHNVRKVYEPPDVGGYWLEGYTYCSECNNELDFETPYCSNCGALMDGGEKHATD